MCPCLYINSCSLATDKHQQLQSDSTTCLGESPIDHITLVCLLVIDNMTRTSRSAHLPLGNSTPPSQAQGQGHGEGSNPRTTSARGNARVERARQTRNERDRKQRRGEIKGIFIPRKQSTVPKNTTKGSKDTAKEDSIDDLYSASSLPHPQQGRRSKEGSRPYDKHFEGDDLVSDDTTTEDLLEPVESKTNHPNSDEIDRADRFGAQPLSLSMALSRSQFESPAWFRFDRSAGSSTSPAPPVTTASVRSPFSDEALEDDGRAASSGDDLHQNVETKRTHNRNNSIDSIDLRSLFGSPSLPSTQVFSPLPSRPLTPLVATAPAQQSQPSDPLLPSPKPAKPPVKRESGGTNNAKPRMVKNKKLQRILNGQKPLRERKDPLRPVLKQTPRREFR